LLKSAFSIIDQMFQQEILNAEYVKKNWFSINFKRYFQFSCLEYFFKSLRNDNYLNIDSKFVYKYPSKLNPFIDRLLDPFQTESIESVENELDDLGKVVIDIKE
jgi:hypothetical protein